MADRVRWGGFWFLYGQTIRLMARLRLWAPLLIQSGIGWVILIILYDPVSSPFSSLIRSWVNLISPQTVENFFRYPVQFVYLPLVFRLSRLWISLFLEAYLLSVMIYILIAMYRGEATSLKRAFAEAGRKYFQLWIVWAVLTGLLYLNGRYFVDLIEAFGVSLQVAPRRQIAAFLAQELLTVIIYALFLFTLPSIMVGGRSFMGAVKRGFLLALRHPFVAFGLVLIPYLIMFVPSWAASRSDRVVASFSPELVFYLLVISILFELIANFLLIGTSVKFFMDQTDEA
jgi:hypothetical protein